MLQARAYFRSIVYSYAQYSTFTVNRRFSCRNQPSIHHTPKIYAKKQQKMQNRIYKPCQMRYNYFIASRHGQVVKTLASHAGIRGSTPLGDTNSNHLKKLGLFSEFFVSIQCGSILNVLVCENTSAHFF